MSPGLWRVKTARPGVAIQTRLYVLGGSSWIRTMKASDHSSSRVQYLDQVGNPKIHFESKEVRSAHVNPAMSHYIFRAHLS